MWNLPIELWPFYQRIRITISNKTVAQFATKAFRMEIVITSDHHWTGNDLKEKFSIRWFLIETQNNIFHSLHCIVDTIHRIWSNNRFCRTADHLFRNTNSIIVHHMPNNGNIERAILDPTPICILHHPIHSGSLNIQVLDFHLGIEMGKIVRWM